MREFIIRVRDFFEKHSNLIQSVAAALAIISPIIAFISFLLVRLFAFLSNNLGFMQAIIAIVGILAMVGGGVMVIVKFFKRKLERKEGNEKPERQEIKQENNPKDSRIENSELATPDSKPMPKLPALVEYHKKYQNCIAGAYKCIVGLQSNGTVVAVGHNAEGQRNIENWQDIIAVATEFRYTVGLKSDGTVVAVGNNEFGRCNVGDWRDIIAVAAGWSHTIGLKSNGTVVAVGNNGDGQCNVEDWRDIIAVAAGNVHTVGLKSDGTVVAVGNNEFGRCNVRYWQDIVAVSAGLLHTIGLKSNGTVVAVGDNQHGQCNVKHLRNIVAVAAEEAYIIGLKSNGTVVTVGRNSFGIFDIIDNWKNIAPPQH
ncbi:MAG: hypothetical protein FWD01_02010 [Defluviitaleaceae bacterium]|nr:hypothetical protein [Defluviitaleaceae bacterium]